MKSTFKAFIAAALLLVAVVLLTPSSQAQSAFPSSGVDRGSWTTNAVLTLTNAQTVTYNSAALYVRKNQGLAIMPWIASSDAANGAVTFTFDVSADGTNYTTSTPFTYAPTLNGTTSVIGYTNWSSTILNNVRYIRLRSIANAHTNTIYCTNLYYSYWP